MPLAPTAAGHNALLTLQAPDGSFVAGQADASGNLQVTGGGGGGGGTVAQGTAAVVTAPWPALLSDGTNPVVAAAAAAADAVANPTAGFLQSLLSAYNGATWDRIRSGLVSVQTTFVGVLNTIGMARYNATPPTLADGNIAPLQSNTTGALRVVSPDVQTAVLDMSATPSNSASTTTVSATITGLSKASAITIIAKNQGSTGGTLDLTLQDSPDGGTTWFDFWHLPQLAAGATQNVLAYVPGINDTVVTIGQGTAGTPGVLLAAGSKRGGHPLDAMRLVMTTGSGVSASVAQTVKVYVTQPTP